MAKKPLSRHVGLALVAAWALAAQGLQPCLSGRRAFRGKNLFGGLETGNMTCRAARTRLAPSFEGFEPGAESCFARTTVGGLVPEGMLFATALGHMAGLCCSDAASVCAPFTMHPCRDGAAFRAGAWMADWHTNCGGVFGHLPAFDASPGACRAEVPGMEGSGMEGSTYLAFTHYAAASCCEDGASVCGEFSMNPCADPSAYDAEKVSYSFSDDGLTCGFMAGTMLPYFVPDADTCAETARGDRTNMHLLAMMQSDCCTDGVGACSRFAMNPCANPDAYVPSATFHHGGDPIPCSAVALPPFVPDADTCAEAVPSIGEMTRVHLFAVMQSACCTDGVSACSRFAMNPCANPDAYVPSATFHHGGDPIPCSAVALPPFAPDADTCAEAVPSVGEMTRIHLFAVMQSDCCTDGVSACSRFAMNPCGNPDAYVPSATFHHGGDPVPCSAVALPPFVPDANTCAEAVPSVGMTRMHLFAVMQSACCTDGVSACSRFAMNPCANPDAYFPSATFHHGGEPVPCSAVALPPFVPDADTCAEEVPSIGEMTNRQLFAVMAPTCCADGNGACSAHFTNPCENPSAFSPGAEVLLGEEGMQSCGLISASLEPFSASADACSEVVDLLGDEPMTRAMLLGMLAPCCSDGVSACAAFGFNPCLEGTSFEPLVVLPLDGTPTCGLMAAYIDPFTASADTCFEVVDMSDNEPTTRAAALEALAPCCKDGATRCAPFSMNPCVPPERPALSSSVVTAGAAEPCGRYLSMVAAFTPSEETCSEEVLFRDTVLPRRALTNWLGHGCCPSRENVCGDYIMDLCAEPASFDASLSLRMGEMPCLGAVGLFAPFTPDAATCSATISFRGESVTRREALARFASACCGGAASVCELATVSGDLELVVSDAAGLAASPGAADAAAALVAEAAGVPRAYVEATLAVGGTRGLAAQEVSTQRLSDTVQVSYAITVPAGVNGVAEAAGAKLGQEVEKPAPAQTPAPAPAPAPAPEPSEAIRAAECGSVGLLVIAVVGITVLAAVSPG